MINFQLSLYEDLENTLVIKSDKMNIEKIMKTF